MNVIPMTSASSLDLLAAKINTSIEKTKDGFIDLAVLLSLARKKCAEKGINWKVWVYENINLSISRANTLARVGDDENPVKALADLREYNRQANEKSREKLTSRESRTPKPGTIIEYDDEYGEDDEEETAPNQLPSSMRIRGFMHRAKEAKEMAEADDLQGVKVTNAMRAAASNAAKAWIELLAKLEGE